MHSITRICAIALLILLPSGAYTQQSAGPYHVLRAVKAGGDGGYDYVSADVAGRRIYIARGGDNPRITVFDLDTLAPAGEIPHVSAHGVVVDSKSGHGFASSKPVLMFDSKTLLPIRTIDVDGAPDGMFFDPSKQRVFVLGHVAPAVTVIDSRDGTIIGTIDASGQAEGMASDGRGHLFVNLIDQASIAAVDANSLKVTGRYDLTGYGGQCTGLAVDPRNRVLFSACRNPQNMVVVNADSGAILGAIPIGLASDGAAFNPATLEAFSAQADGTVTVVKENTPTSFALEQTVQTMRNAKTMTLDTKTNHLILIGADYEKFPGPGIVRGAGPNPMIPGSFTILVVGRE